MTNTSYEVRIGKTELYRGSRTTTYWVRWSVARKRQKAPFKTKGLADSYRSELVTAARQGQAFDIESGLPLAMLREKSQLSWYELATSYVDMKWSSLAGNSRRSVAESLTNATCALVVAEPGFDWKIIRTALRRWAFNTKRRSEEGPIEVPSVLRWIEHNTKPVGALIQPDTLYTVLKALATTLEGKPVSANTYNRKHAVLYNVLDYALARGVLEENPLNDKRLKKRALSTSRKVRSTVDRRSVINPMQARDLLDALEEVGPSGPRLKAFFGMMYYAGLRPEEAVYFSEQNLVSLPDNLVLYGATPDAGGDWTDSGQTREVGPLKHRAEGESRRVPCVPELRLLLEQHLERFGTNHKGLLFRGVRTGGLIDSSTYERVWAKARIRALTPWQAASPLARRPYDLRHAAVSTWLNAGVEPSRVAEWAGHSVEVLLRVYASCLDGTEEVARDRMVSALRGSDT